MVVVSRGRLLSKGSFSLIVWDAARVWDARSARSCPEGLGELAARPLIVLASALQAAAGSQEGLNPGVESGCQPGLPPVD